VCGVEKGLFRSSLGTRGAWAPRVPSDGLGAQVVGNSADACGRVPLPGGCGTHPRLKSSPPLLFFPWEVPISPAPFCS